MEVARAKAIGACQLFAAGASGDTITAYLLKEVPVPTQQIVIQSSKLSWQPASTPDQAAADKEKADKEKADKEKKSAGKQKPTDTANQQ